MVATVVAKKTKALVVDQDGQAAQILLLPVVAALRAAGGVFAAGVAGQLDPQPLKVGAQHIDGPSDRSTTRSAATACCCFEASQLLVEVNQRLRCSGGASLASQSSRD